MHILADGELAKTSPMHGNDACDSPFRSVILSFRSEDFQLFVPKPADTSGNSGLFRRYVLRFNIGYGVKHLLGGGLSVNVWVAYKLARKNGPLSTSNKLRNS
jgi:hypothetical protein